MYIELRTGVSSKVKNHLNQGLEEDAHLTLPFFPLSLFTTGMFRFWKVLKTKEQKPPHKVIIHSVTSLNAT